MPNARKESDMTSRLADRGSFTIRRATEADQPALARLAVLDSARPGLRSAFRAA
jgi:hypothetical protein